MSEHTTKPNVEYLLNYLRANEDDVADSFPCGVKDLKQPMVILAAAPDLLAACEASLEEFKAILANAVGFDASGRRNVGHTSIERQLRAAIAKAKL